MQRTESSKSIYERFLTGLSQAYPPGYARVREGRASRLFSASCLHLDAGKDEKFLAPIETPHAMPFSGME